MSAIAATYFLRYILHKNLEISVLIFYTLQNCKIKKDPGNCSNQEWFNLRENITITLIDDTIAEN